jgi:phage terminase large subunit-like protein
LRLAREYRVREVIFDPDFFARSSELLAARGLTVAPIDQRSRVMREAYSQFYEAVGAGQVVHDGDPVLASHVTSAAATLDEYGGWKVRKTKQSRKIDGLVASVIAFSRAAREQPSVYGERPLLMLGGDEEAFALAGDEHRPHTVDGEWVS